jgi:single-strand DNA-binding protein
MNATIFGRVGKDAELKESQSGTVYARFSVALNVYDKQERLVTWVHATLFGKMAESLAEYITKGSAIALTGDLKLREYDGGDGVKTTLDMNVQSVALLGGGTQTDQAKPATRPAQKTAAASAGAAKGGYKKPAPAEIHDEDISF